jgi:RNA polymerase sigma factor (sigma-70 family)
MPVVPEEPLRNLLRRLRSLAGQPAEGTIPDAQLLERFVHHRDEAAFELLIWRHGPMVLGLCRRVLRQEQDAEDAFQATFLTLARKAGSIGKREACASWLYKVAYRISLAARASANRRGQAKSVSEDLAVEDADVLAWRDLRPVLDEEVNRLPERYRAAFVLCCVQGKTNEEAAELLGCPTGTVLSRLSRARERLRGRLTRRGVGLAVGLLVTGLATQSQASVPALLVGTTTRAALASAVGKTTAGIVSARVAELTQGAIQTMFLSKVKTVCAVALALALVGGVAGFGLRPGKALIGVAEAADEHPKPKAPADEAVTAKKPLGDEVVAQKKRFEAEFTDKAKVDEKDQMIHSVDNLKQIGLAIHNYADANGHLPPPAIYGKDGKALLSWRVMLLPYLEQQNLYKAFHLDEPWDSEHNKTLAQTIVKIYAPVGPAKDKSLTYYQAFVGTGAAFEPKKKLQFSDITDGTSNTFFVAEAGDPVPWTKPEDLPYVPDQRLPKLGGLFESGFHVLFGDGSVRFFPRNIDEKILRVGITRDAGDIFDPDRIPNKSTPKGEGGTKSGAILEAFEKDFSRLQSSNDALRDQLAAQQAQIQKMRDDISLLKQMIAKQMALKDEKARALMLEQEKLRDQLQASSRELEELKALREQLMQALDALKKK